MCLRFQIESVKCCFTSQPADSRAEPGSPKLHCIVGFMMHTGEYFIDRNCSCSVPVNNLKAINCIKSGRGSVFVIITVY